MKIFIFRISLLSVFLFSFLTHYVAECQAQFSQFNMAKLGWVGEADQFEISPDNKFLAVASHKYMSSEGYLKIYDNINKNPEIAWDLMARKRVQDLKFSKGGKYFGYCSEDSIHIINIKLEKQIIISYAPFKIKTFDISSDENFVVVGFNEYEKGYISLYDLGRMKEIYQVECGEMVSRVKYLNYSQLIAVNGRGYSRGYLKIFEAINGNLKYFLYENNYGGIDMITLTSDNFLISQEDNFLSFWDVCYSQNSGVRNSRIPEFETLAGIDVSPDNNYISYLTEKAKKINIQDLKQNKVVEVSSPDDVLQVKFSPDFKYIYWITLNNLYKYKISGLYKSKLFSKVYKDQLKEISNQYKLYNARGEFETLEDYFSRMETLNTKIFDIKSKYSNKISEQEGEVVTSSEKKFKDLSEEISKSIKDTTLKIQSVGIYDPDSQMLPVEILGILKNVNIPLSDAKSFKEGYKNANVKAKCKYKADLKTYEFYDIIIFHPITNAEYTF